MNAAGFRRRAQHWWRTEIRPLLILVLVLCSIRSSLADWYSVPSGSMQPTILVGDRVFVNKLAYDLKVPFTTWHLAAWGNPQPGDVVVFYSPYDGQRLVKRVIGLPGDTVELRNERLYLNGEPVDYAPLAETISAPLPAAERQASLFAIEKLGSHPHAVMATPALRAPRNFGPRQVPAGSYFVMGDNRDNSFDSRFWGFVPRQQILGRATTVVMSFNHDNHWLPRGHRFLRSLDQPGAE